MRGLSALGFHLIGKAVFWLKSLHRLAFVCFFWFLFLDWGYRILTICTRHLHRRYRLLFQACLLRRYHRVLYDNKVF